MVRASDTETSVTDRRVALEDTRIRANAIARAGRARWLRCVRTVASSFEGRIALQKMLLMTKLYDDPVITEDTHVMAGAMGQRSHGAWLRRELLLVGGADLLANMESDYATTPLEEEIRDA